MGENLDISFQLFKKGTAILIPQVKFDIRRTKSWFSIQPASILGKKEGTTIIDTLNRILLSEDQVKKCKFIGYLSDAQFEDVMEAKAFADMWLRLSSGQK